MLHSLLTVIIGLILTEEPFKIVSRLNANDIHAFQGKYIAVTTFTIKINIFFKVILKEIKISF